MAEILQYILLYRMRVPIKHLSPSPRAAANGVWRRQMPLDARCVCVSPSPRDRRRTTVAARLTAFGAAKRR